MSFPYEKRHTPGKGSGIFATRHIPAGEVVMDDSIAKQIITAETYLALPPKRRVYVYQATLQTLFAPIQFEKIDDIWFVNHSCDPNTRKENNLWVSSRPIQSGEEITHDYAILWFNNIEPFEINPCRCGAGLCRGKMTGDDWKLPELQARYKGQFPNDLETLMESRP